jgi:putative ABC transport system permease protein
MDSIARDIKIAFRALLKSPGATAVAVLALALGIGVNVSSFITVNALVLHPLAYPGLERIETLWETVPKARDERDSVAPANFLDWKTQSHVFEHVAAYRPWDATLMSSGDPERVQGCLASAEFFALLGLKPTMGRVFSADETEPGRDGVVVVSQGFWRGRMGAAPDAVGRSITLGRRGYKVVGVMPADFDYPLATDLWAPLSMTAEEKNERAARDLAVLARLKPGVSVKRAQAEMDGIARGLSAEYPKTNKDRGVTVKPIRELINNVTDRFCVALLGVAGFVLLLACANVGNLQLSRAAARQKLFAVEAALGASRFRIARQLALEGLALSLAGGIIGLWLANWNVDYARTVGIPAEVLRWVAGIQYMRVDGTVLAFSLAASIAAGLLCGLPAAFHLLRRKAGDNLAEVLKEGGRGSGMGSSRSRLRSALMVLEVALALVLLVGAGLMVRTFNRLLAVNPGFEPRNLLTMEVALPAATYRDDARITEFYDRAIRELAVVPGVKEVGASGYMSAAEGFFVEGRPDPGPADPIPGTRAASSEYLQALGLPLLAGRFLSARDRVESPRVVVLSESVARHYWKGRGFEDAVGQHVRLSANQSQWLTVVGVVGDVRNWFTQQPERLAFIPCAQSPQLSMQFIMRTAGDPMRAAPAARAAIRNVDPYQPVYEVKSMEQWIAEESSGVRATANSMTIYAVIALLLAVTGIYAVVSYSVVQRTHEIGIRMALGAGRTEVLKLTLGYAMRMTGMGLSIGIPVAFLMMRFMSRFLYDVVIVDALTIAAFAAILGAAALAAGYIPARQAAALDPLAALRVE